EEEYERGGPKWTDEGMELAGLPHLLGAVVCAARLVDEQRAEEDRRHDGEHEDQEHEDRRRHRARAAEQADQPRGQGVEGQRQDRSPRQRSQEGRQEEEELIEQQPEDDEEERREEPLARHDRTVSTGGVPYKDVSP